MVIIMLGLLLETGLNCNTCLIVAAPSRRVRHNNQCHIPFCIDIRIILESFHFLKPENMTDYIIGTPMRKLTRSAGRNYKRSQVIGYLPSYRLCLSLHWRHNNHDGVSNHQPHGCLLSRLFRRRSKKTSKLRVTGLCVGNSPGPVNSPHKGPVTRKVVPFDDVIMYKSRW